MFTQMTDKQIAMFSRKLASCQSFHTLPLVKLVEVTEAFAQVIASELNNPLKKIKYMPYLEKVGFKGL